MPHLVQTREFKERLNDFGPELARFLELVWNKRAQINLANFDTGTSTIYGIYSGVSGERPYKYSSLKTFVDNLRKAAGNYSIHPQGFNCLLSDFRDVDLKTYGKDLWGDFFHVLSSPKPTKNIRSRVYVHAADATASVTLMDNIIQQFGKNTGLWEAKTAGPGSTRLDTIVCYLYDTESADALADTLKKAPAGLFTDSLPPLVKKAGTGIGLADEPPAIEIYKHQGKRHSFGSFFSTLCWVALKTTPKVKDPKADGRHMLDNMLYSLRLLQVSPNNPQRFPQAAALERWYRASIG